MTKQIFIVQLIHSRGTPKPSYKEGLHMTIIPPVFVEDDKLTLEELATYKFLSSDAELFADTFEWFGFKEKNIPAITYKAGSFVQEVRNLLMNILGVEQWVPDDWQPHITLKPGLPMPPEQFRFSALSIIDKKTKETIREVFV